MKLFKLKRKNIILVSLLAIAGFLGISSVAISEDNKNISSAKKAEAASITLYCDIPSATIGSYSMLANVNEKGDGDQWSDHGMTDTGWTYNGNKVYSVTFSSANNGLGALYFKVMNGGSEVSYVKAFGNYEWKGTSTFSGKLYHYNSIKATGDTFYKVTYNPNGGTGSQKIQLKLSGASYTIADFTDVGMGSTAGKYCKRWATGSSDTGSKYLPGNTYNTNSNLNLYLIQFDYKYQVILGGGDPITLSKDEWSASGYIGQWSTSQSFTAGESIVFQRYDDDKAAEDITITLWENNSNAKNGNIIYSGSGGIYLKVATPAGFNVYVDGYSLRGIDIYRPSESADYKIPGSFDESKSGQQIQQFIIQSITIFPGDVLKGVYDGGTYENVTIENGASYGFSGTTASAPGVFKAYLKSEDWGNNYNKIYLDQVADTASVNATAVLIAQFFNDAIEPICESIEGGGGSPSDLSTPWSTQATYYTKISDNAKAELKANTQGSTDIAEFLARYKQVVNKRGMNNYLGLTPNELSASSYRGITSLFGSEDNFSTIVIVISSSVALLSVTALSILVIRKRKSKED